MQDLLFVIPMKDPDKGKSRLASVLPAPARRRLAIALFRQVLTFLRDNQPAHGVLVVTGSDKVIQVAGEYKALTLLEADTGLNNAISQAAEWAKSRYKSICILPADLADPDPDDLAQLLAYPRDGRYITIAPSHDGGTNCLITSPPGTIAFRYGPGSSHAHQREAVANGIACTIAPLSSFAWDIDTSADLHRLRLKTDAP
ncbi:MAG: 2-phospho-L-lactate guanylyltransferase [Rhodobacteraceae bacterium]|nr:2-phospho-L-lactate guanylyltransferase [Paracoccaceae bacterium]